MGRSLENFLFQGQGLALKFPSIMLSALIVEITSSSQNQDGIALQHSKRNNENCEYKTFYEKFQPNKCLLQRNLEFSSFYAKYFANNSRFDANTDEQYV